MIALPSYIDPELWSAFVETRKAMKVPFTSAAQKLIVRKLMKMHSEGWDVNASLEKSAIYGYRGVFEVSKIATKSDADEKINAMHQKWKDEDAKAAPMPKEIREKIAGLLGKKVANAG